MHNYLQIETCYGVKVLSRSDTNSRPEAFVAFEGGGAKGLLHVGALRTLEKNKVVYRGVAGTSAGAIIAALVAAGLTAEDLFSSKKGKTLMDLLQKHDRRLQRPTDLFSAEGWKRVTCLRFFIAHYKWFAAVVFAIVISLFGAFVFAAGQQRWGISSFFFICFAITFSTIYFTTRNVLRGMCELDQLRDAAAKLLNSKIFPDDPDREVLMGDFGDKAGRPSLKIVSANLKSRTLHLFSPEETSEVPVADAIAASICIPVIFKPWRVKGNYHVDGGIVSNLPAWPFDEERELYPDATTISFKIGAPSSHASGWWLPAFVHTALFGTARLSTRIFGSSVQVDMPTQLDTLDFDLPWNRAVQEVADAEAFTRVRLERELFELPTLFEESCRVIKDLTTDVISDALEVDPKRVRVAVAVPDPGYYHSFRLRYAAGFEQDLDSELLLPKVGSIMGASISERRIMTDCRPFKNEYCLMGTQNRRRNQLTWTERSWVVAVPVFSKNATVGDDPAFVVQIDGNMDLSGDKLTIDLVLQEIGGTALEFFAQVVEKLNRKEGKDA